MILLTAMGRGSFVFAAIVLFWWQSNAALEIRVALPARKQRLAARRCEPRGVCDEHHPYLRVCVGIAAALSSSTECFSTRPLAVIFLKS
jgi:hypothetical protein